MRQRIETSADAPPKNCQTWHGGKLIRVSSVVLDGIRVEQRNRAPRLDLILTAEMKADIWLRMICQANSRALLAK